MLTVVEKHLIFKQHTHTHTHQYELGCIDTHTPLKKKLIVLISTYHKKHITFKHFLCQSIRKRKKKLKLLLASTNYIFSNHQQNCFLVETNCESHRRSTYQRHHPDKKKRYISTQTLFTLYRNFSHKTMFQAILLYSTPKNESITAKSERHKHTIPPLHRINAKF